MKSSKLRAICALLFVLFAVPIFAADVNLQIVTRAREVIPERNWDEYPTIADAIRENTPVHTRTYGDGGSEFLVIRGYNKGVQIYLDDVPLPQDMTGLTDLSLIPTSIVDRIVIAEGFNPASPNSTGSVYIYTRKPVEGATIFDTSAYTGSYNTNMLSLAMRGAALKVPYSISYARNSSDGFQQNSAYTKDAMNVSFTPLKDQTLNYNFMRNNAGLPGGTMVPIGEWNGIREREAVSLTDYLINTMHQASYSGSYEKFKYGTAYSNTKLEGKSYGDLVDIENNDIFAYGEYALSKFLTAGISYRYSSIEAPELYAFGYVDRPAYYWNQYGVYANSTIPNDIANVDLGARYDYNDLWHSSFSYKAKLSKGKQTMVYASASSGQITPSIGDYGNQTGNLKPETNLEFELGLEGQYIDFNFKLSPYLKFIDDKIILTTSTWSAYNAGNARILGVEAQASKTIGLFRTTAIYTLMDGKIKPYGEGDYVAMQYTPQQALSFNNSLKMGSWRAIGILYAQSAQYTGNNRTGDKLPGYADIELSLEKKIADATVFATASNILDKHYAINGGYGTFYPCAGRIFKLGVRYQFSK